VEKKANAIPVVAASEPGTA